MSVVAPELASVLSNCKVCQPWAEQDEGPYHRDAQPVRRDIIEDREGVPLQLGIRLSDLAGSPVACDVEVWQCDALGRYSGFQPPQTSRPVTSADTPRTQYLSDQTFLRGVQSADEAGMVEFRTIYPGWYPGRTVHIHIIVRADDSSFTSQLYFEDELTDAVFASAPYSSRPGRDTTNDSDTIFPTGGDPAVLDVAPTHDRYRAVIGLALPLSSGTS